VNIIKGENLEEDYPKVNSCGLLPGLEAAIVSLKPILGLGTQWTAEGLKSKRSRIRLEAGK
jgi:hypothetical protein